MRELCYLCKGKGLCGKQCKILARLRKFQPKVKLEFSGSASEIFVGRHGYPSVFTGILAPNIFGDTEIFSMPELWFRERASIDRIMQYRSRLIYSRFKLEIRKNNKLHDAVKEIALASKSVATEFKLMKKPVVTFKLDLHMPIVGNPAPLKKAVLQENPHIERKAEYITGDYDLKAEDAVNELYRAKIEISNIIKILSAGLIGVRFQRKLVPSRWATTATDDIISKRLIKKIREFREISEFLLFNSEYLGNHYEILLIPSVYSFEVIEAKMPGSVWNPYGKKLWIAQDFELYNCRKDYASSVSGAYYANRLALAEYLLKIKKQASCLVMREVREEYWAPCGVGVLREVTREAFRKKPERFSTLSEALEVANKRLRLPIEVFIKRSKLLEEFKKQKKLIHFGI